MSKAKKRTRYKLHQTRYQQAISSKKHSKIWRKAYGEFTPSSFYRTTSAMANSIGDSVSLLTDANEIHWLNSSRKTIFLSDDALQMLLRAKFHTTNHATVAVQKGFSTFTVAVPKDCFFCNEDGVQVEIHPFLINVMTHREWDAQVKTPYQKICDINIKSSEQLQANPDELLINLIYSTPPEYAAFHTVERVSDVVSILQEGVRDKKLLTERQTLSPTEKIEMQIALKLALALLIYTSAKEGSNIISGYPDDCVFDLGDGLNNSFLDAQHFQAQIKKTTELAHAKNEGGHKLNWHVRSAHLRNLQHERFYQGKYSWLPKGARWVLVEESEIGDIDSYQLSNTD